MKLSYLLINVLLVGGGIVINDLMKSPERAPAAQDVYDPLRADDSATPEPTPRDGAPMTSGGMRGSADKANLRALEDRIASLERTLSRLPRGDGSGDERPLPTGGKLPELAATDFIDPVNPSYDEKTIQTLAAYVDEINRRKQLERQRERVDGELTRLGLELPEDQKRTVVDETLKFQDKSRDLLRQNWARDAAGAEALRQAFQGLQEEYVTTIKRLVPADAAEKITTSRIARGMGFYAGTESVVDGGNQRFGGGGRGRRGADR